VAFGLLSEEGVGPPQGRCPDYRGKLTETEFEFVGLPSVLESDPDSRVVLLAYLGGPCTQSPVIEVHQADNSIQTQITPRQADPSVDCDAAGVAWLIELTLREVLGNRTVEVTPASEGG